MKIPARSEVPSEYRWDLGSLFGNDAEWEAAMGRFGEGLPALMAWQGRLGESPALLRRFLDDLHASNLLEERLGTYAFLRYAEDGGDSANQARQGRFIQVATDASAKLSFVTPEIQRIPDDTMERFLADESLAEYRIFLRKLLHWKPHVLPEEQERLLALQQEANMTAWKSFQSLIDIDMDFGAVETPEGDRPLTQSTFGVFMLDPRRDVRRQAYERFLLRFDQHKQTLTSLYAGSVSLDIYRARVRGFSSARAMALFPDRVPETLYDTLVSSVRASLPTLHRYYRLRRRLLRFDELRLWDTKVPLIPEIAMRHTYGEAVDVVVEALRPLGREYIDTLRVGLTGGWVDRYENRGKRAGAFSAGTYTGNPYILMNFKEDDVRDLFTLAHEAGHSMHSHYSVGANPFQHYDYTIFEAEVASTVNEQLLSDWMRRQTGDEATRTYLLSRQIDDIVATLYRQTMFAEYEHVVHRLAEGGTPLTLDRLREEYRALLSAYFGEAMALEEHSDLEGLRIPHFYRAFYVYKYATGISAAISIAAGLLNGDEGERQSYFAFLQSGGSRYPLESLALAGVDLSDAAPIERSLKVFGARVEELERYFDESS